MNRREGIRMNRGTRIERQCACALLLFGAAILFAPLPAAGQGENVEVVGHIDLGGNPWDLHVTNDLAYVRNTSPTGTVQIIDVSDPSSPTFVNSFRAIDDGGNIQVEGNRAYLALPWGFQIFDVTDRLNPTLLGDYITTDNLIGLYVSSGFAYYGGWDRFVVTDVSDPSSVSIVGASSAFVIDVDDAKGNIVYGTISMPSANMVIYDVTNPAQPIRASVSSPGVSSSVFDVEEESGYAYCLGNVSVADSTIRLTSYDVSNPYSPTIASWVDLPPNPGVTPPWYTDFSISDGLAYVVSEKIVHVVDVANPGAPARVGWFQPGIPRRVYTTGGFAYVVSDNGLWILQYDPQNVAPNAPTGLQASDGSEADRISLRWNASPGADEYRVYRSTSLVGTKTAVSGWIAANSFDDLAANPAVTYYYWVKARNAVGESDYSAPDTGWRMPQSPMNMTWVGGYDIGDVAFNVFVRDNLAYVAASQGLYIVDVSDPASPTLRGARNAIGGEAFTIDVAGNVAYLGVTERALATVDVSDPAAPSLPSFVTAANSMPDVHVLGNLLYTAGGAALQIYDLTDPMSPNVIGQHFTSMQATGVFPLGDRVYVAAGPNLGLLIFDVSEPTTPSVIGSYATPGWAFDVWVENDVAYVTDGGIGLPPGWADGRLHIINVADPANPYALYTFDTPGTAIRLHVSDNVVFIADGDSGVEALRVQNPELPQFRGYYDTDGQANSVFVVGNLVFVADGTNGLVILRLGGIPSLSVRPTWPLYE